MTLVQYLVQTASLKYRKYNRVQLNSEPQKREQFQGMGRGQGCLIIWRVWSGCISGLCAVQASGSGCDYINITTSPPPSYFFLPFFFIFYYFSSSHKLSELLRRLTCTTTSASAHSYTTLALACTAHNQTTYPLDALSAIHESFLCLTSVLFSQAHCCYCFHGLHFLTSVNLSCFTKQI